MLKPVLALVVPIALAAAFFGRNAATLSSSVEGGSAAQLAARDAPAPADRSGCRRGEEYVVSADAQGHFRVSTEIDGHFTWMIVDTGATRVVLPHEEAVRIGVRFDDTRRAEVRTANGVVGARVAQARRLRVGPICLDHVDVLVMPPGQLSMGLLGMNVLGSVRFEMSRARLVMTQ